jgi:hypothetical protein
VVIPRRGDFYELDQLKLAGDLGQILYHVSFDYLVLETLTESSTGVMVLTPLSTIFHLFRDGYFYWKKKLEYLEKTTDQSQVTDKRVFYKE